MNNEWIDNIKVDEMVYLASFDHIKPFDPTKHTLSFYYGDYLIVVNSDATQLVIYKYRGNFKGFPSFKSIFDFNYFQKESEPKYTKFINNYKILYNKLTFNVADKMEIAEKYRIQKRKAKINELL